MRANSPYRDPEHLRSMIIIPFDYETQVLAEQQDEARARYLFALQTMRRERLDAAKGILAGLAICLIGWGVAVWWCLL
jgi:hypothetical protein